MKRFTRAFALLFSLVIMLCGCASEQAESSADSASSKEKIAVVTPSPTVADVLEEKASDAKESADSSDESADSTDEGTALSSIEGVDIDLTALSSTMVYGQVYNMMYYPENFLGQTIRMEGLFSEYFDQAKGRRYFACIIMDATACCSQGIEFELTDDYSYPADYPEVGDDVVVEGVFDLYEEDGYDYCVLRNSKLITS